MATVVNKALGSDEGVDVSYVNASRTNAGEPNGVLTPAFAGEIVLDTTDNCLWKALTLVNNSWVALTAPN